MKTKNNPAEMKLSSKSGHKSVHFYFTLSIKPDFFVVVVTGSGQST